ncbi:hemagglutinin, partial [Aeromonas salmonicida]
MNKIYLAVALACWGSSALAAELVTIERVAGPQQVSADGKGVSALVGGGDYRAVRTVILPNGEKRVRFEQTWQGVPVWGSALVAEQGASGIERVSGQQLVGIDQDVASPQPAFNAATAAQKARGQQQGRNEKVRLFVMQDESGQARLVYQVSYLVEGSETPSRPFVI